MSGVDFDVAIVGAGPAGLSAALWLGRCRRRVIVFDAGTPRNEASPALHGYLSRDGVTPAELRDLGHRDVAHYRSVRFKPIAVTAIQRKRGGFVVTPSSGAILRVRLVLLATGRRDEVPAVPGFAKFYGRGVYHCPYCDGWEHRDERLVVYDPNGAGSALAELLHTWSRDIIFCTDGRPVGKRILRTNAPVITEQLLRAVGDRNDRLRALRFVGGRVLPCTAVFFCSNCIQQSALPAALGCILDRSGSVACRAHAAIGVPGLFVAGNIRGGVHLAITAAAEGAEAALAMNEQLLATDMRKGPGRRKIPPA
jgi:thioredoxin reductase